MLSTAEYTVQACAVGAEISETGKNSLKKIVMFYISSLHLSLWTVN